jgi:hypothetical protein
MAEAKKRPWIMQTLLQRGPDNLGTTAEQHEAAIEIAEAFEALTSIVACKSSSLSSVNGCGQSWARDIGLHGVRLASIYLAWGKDLLLRHRLRPYVVVEWINMERALGCSHIPLLLKSLDLWTKHRDERRPPQLTTTSDERLTTATRGGLCDKTTAHTSQHPHADPPTDASRAVAQAS